ncbi:MAG TPA: SpoIIE family protein phosphatase [Acidobacteriaceae bacterium]|nr:SpoIIE family protein phosphatase [Acidobacteriaceae bacterium]
MKKSGLLLLLALLPVSPSALSQPAPILPAAASPQAQVITLNNSAVNLPGPWKFAPGDSPIVNGAPLWAQPGFDDSNWVQMDVAPKNGSIDPAYGTEGFVPGWTKQGFPNLYGYAWYRLRLHINDSGKPLWLKMPNDIDDAYQIYANGHFVGQFGDFTPHEVKVYSARSISFQLPPVGPDGTLVLAFRFYMTGGTFFQSTDAGGMHQPPAIGLASTIHLLQASDDDANLHFYLGTLFQSLLFLLLAPLALWAWLKNRQDRAYFWLFLALLFPLQRILTIVGIDLSSTLSLGTGQVWIIGLLGQFALLIWAMFWWHWFGLQSKRWIPRTAWILTAAVIIAQEIIRLPMDNINVVPHTWLNSINTAAALILAALGALLLVILVEGFRRDRIAALVAVVPILLIELASFAPFLLGRFGISNQFYPYGIGISTGAIASIVMVLVIATLVARRFLRSQVQQQLARQTIAQDLEQAQQLQQRVLIPEDIHSPCFHIETAYHPAQTVGGDFFQTLTRTDGSLLIVIGDVSGKGISAAMLVAVIVGAIRNQVETTFDPSAMLATLNRRLVGRSGGHFATCLVAEIHPDGAMRVANAGHLPPYLNGNEMDIEGSLPLGTVAEVNYPVHTFTLQPADRLTFMTDGVVEATNAAKELFGFDRTRAISNQHADAIAEQAQAFGQNDDITVLSLEFTAAATPALA